jgi:hypothetical protein
MKNITDYSKYECPYSHVEKECGHELHGPEGFAETFGVWCACGFRGPVFCLEPEQLKLKLKQIAPPNLTSELADGTAPESRRHHAKDICQHCTSQIACEAKDGGYPVNGSCPGFERKK